MSLELRNVSHQQKYIKRNIEAEFNNLIKFENLLDNNHVFLIPASLKPLQIARNVLNILMAEKEDKGSTTKIGKLRLTSTMPFKTKKAKCHGHHALQSSMTTP